MYIYVSGSKVSDSDFCLLYDRDSRNSLRM